MFPEFDLDKGLKAINAVKSSYKAPGKDWWSMHLQPEKKN
jgi:hypothetical protein